MIKIKYNNPYGAFGIGSDIKWCHRAFGGKFCLYCGNKASFKEWSSKWKWFYLIEWTNGWKRYSHIRNIYYYKRKFLKINPIRYRTLGISESQFRNLLNKGCKKNKKCKCSTLIQRGNWYCPSCYYILERMAKHSNIHIHNLMIKDRKELKKEGLILLLSGIL